MSGPAGRKELYELARSFCQVVVARKVNGRGETMSVDRNERVLEMVEDVLRDDPDASTGELQDRAAEIDPRIGELSPRSFNARYPLQVRRKLSREKKERGSEETSAGEALESALREQLVAFARDVAGAEDRGEVIDVLRSVDEYVDRVMENA